MKYPPHQYFLPRLLFLILSGAAPALAQHPVPSTFSAMPESCRATKQTLVTSARVLSGSGRSDTFDIYHYQIDLDLTSVQQGDFQARAILHLAPRPSGIKKLRLDLLPHTVDSLRWRPDSSQSWDTAGLSFQHSGETLAVQWTQALPARDSLQLEISYRGTPSIDASGWGGFHTDQGYYYNLGVGFAANPHSYGRAWFPCFDNFKEKSTFELRVKSSGQRRALLSGDSLHFQPLAGDTLWTSSRLNKPIPSYLVSFALSNYEILRDTIQARQGIKEILLAAKKGDTAALQSSFRNLKPTFHAFEDYYGPYRWPRLGYAVTTVGAMEHATSIHYPRNLVDGSLQGESIMAHELAHHWFGNLVTCATDDDMWINEGMAEYSSHLYEEQVYGKSNYEATVRENAWNVLQDAHRRDNGYRPLYDPPHQYVYGYTVYQKGAMVGHNLRHYLGDSLFFGSLRQVFQDHAYGNLSTAEFRDEMIRVSGKPFLTAFWDQWIYNPGFPQFSVREWNYHTVQQTVDLILEQRLYEAPDLYQQVPVEVTFFGPQGQRETRRLQHSDTLSQHQGIPMPFQPQAVLASYRPGLLTATGLDHLHFQDSTAQKGTYTQVTVEPRPFLDTGSVVVMEHLVGARKQASSPYDFHLGQHHYFTIQPLDFQDSQLEVRLPFDGSSRGWDRDLLNSGNDSLAVLYRPDGSQPWNIFPHQAKITASPNSRRGLFELRQVQAGDYCLANTGESVDLETYVPRDSVELYPQPAREKLLVEWPRPGANLEYSLIDVQGKELRSGHIQLPAQEYKFTLSLKGLPAGTYQLQLGRHQFSVQHR